MVECFRRLAIPALVRLPAGENPPGQPRTAQGNAPRRGVGNLSDRLGEPRWSKRQRDGRVCDEGLRVRRKQARPARFRADFAEHPHHEAAGADRVTGSGTGAAACASIGRALRGHLFMQIVRGGAHLHTVMMPMLGRRHRRRGSARDARVPFAVRHPANGCHCRHRQNERDHQDQQSAKDVHFTNIASRGG